ncbi:uncharacterized protein LOC122646781 isoform X1 [Telopea speciosissima]|uniref:uncharacterized protein LOC122646781 isoform X1 n=1 Tax=Telopea speciosissima TaxID=54955 RepID=UPI001CC7BF81|nr:uncharacterized protein LOC122646781 isoform X1 [Telopea speciosissima]
MGRVLGNGEGDESLSGSDKDESLDEDMEALKRACILTGTNPNEIEDVSAVHAAASDSEGNDSGTNDVEVFRSLQQRFLPQSEGGAPLVLKPLSTLPPVFGSDDEEDFETLRAIQRRFTKYNSDALKKCESTSVHNPNTSLTSEQDTHNILLANDTTGEALDNEFSDYEDACSAYEHSESVGDGDPRSQPLASIEWHQPVAPVLSSIPPKYSSFPASGKVFIDAIKNNRSCQRFIRSKLIEIEARIEENRKLLERIKVLKDFQSSCKKRAGRAFSQKKDVRVQLISVPKFKNSQDLKANGKKTSALSYGPVENSHVQFYRTVLTTLFPLSLRRQSWSQMEKENLAQGIKQHIQEMLFDKSLVFYSGSEGSSGASDAVDSIIASITDLEFTPENIRSFLPKIDWQRLASMHFMGRSGAECEARWLNIEDPLINHNAWTKYEDKKLLHLLQERGTPYNWIDIATRLETNRTPFQCLSRYQRSLNNHIIKRGWAPEEDAQLCAAVEAFGEGYWQLVASNLEGRTGTQCSNRWRKTLHPSRKMVGRWTVDEDKRLKVAVMLFGPKSWSKIAKFVPGRTQVQCRERWVNVLDPSLNLGEWTEEEDNKLEAAIKEHGYCWSKVAAAVPPRTDSQCRRRWKVLFPHEVPLLQAARKIQKAALISNFVDRESERPELGAGDFLALPGANSIPGSENGNSNGKEKKRSSDIPKSKPKRSRTKAQIYPEEALSPTNCDDAETIGSDDTSKKRKAPKLPSKRKKSAKSVQDHQDHSSTPRDSTCLRAMNGAVEAVGSHDTTKEKKTPRSLSRSNRSTKPAPGHQSVSFSAEDSTTLRIRNADDVETSAVGYDSNSKKKNDAETIGSDDTSSKKRKAPKLPSKRKIFAKSVQDHQDHSSTPRDSTYLRAMNGDVEAVCGNDTTKEKKTLKVYSRHNRSTKPAPDHQSLSFSAEDSTTLRIRNADDVETSGVDYANSKKKNAIKVCPNKRKYTEPMQDSHNLNGNNVGTTGMEDYHPKKKKPNTGPDHPDLSLSAVDSGCLKITNVDVHAPGVDYTTSKKKNAVKACSERSKCTESTQGNQDLNGNNIESTGGGVANSENKKDPRQCSKRKMYAKSAHDHQNVEHVEITGGDNCVPRKREASSSCSKKGKCINPTQDHQVHTSPSEHLTSLWVATVEDVEAIAEDTVLNCVSKVHGSHSKNDKCIAPQEDSQDLSLCSGQLTLDVIDASSKVESRVADVTKEDGSEKLTKEKPCFELSSQYITECRSSSACITKVDAIVPEKADVQEGYCTSTSRRSHRARFSPCYLRSTDWET